MREKDVKKKMNLYIFLSDKIEVLYMLYSLFIKKYPTFLYED